MLEQDEADHVRDILYLIGWVVFSTLFACYALASIGFLLGISLHKNLVLVGTVVGVVGTIWISRSRRHAPWKAVCGLSAASLLVFTAIRVASQFYDVSWDGQVYHQEAIIQLSHGWNPAAGILPDGLLPNRVMLAVINYFPKFSWTLSALSYQWTGQIEAAKSITWLLLFASFAVTYCALAALGSSRKIALLISLVAVLNPVVSTQLYSFYIDSHVYLLLLSMMAASALMLKQPNAVHLILGMMIYAMLINTKFTAAVYGTIALIPVLIGLSRSVDMIRVKPRLYGSVVGIGVLLTALLCVHPYATNFLDKGHVFHPVMGAEPVQVLPPTHRPKDFSKINRFESLSKSLLARTANLKGEQSSEFKWPFQLDWPNELDAAKVPDARIAGFGPWFSGSLLLAAVGLIVALGRRRRLVYGAASLLFGATIIFTVLINPEPWWARYVPQLYLVPILVACLLVVQRAAVPTLMAYGIALVLAVNASMMASASFAGNREVSIAIDEQLELFRKRPGHLQMYFDDFRSNRIRLEEAGIAFLELESDRVAACGRKAYVVQSLAHACTGRRRE